jgi:aldehyde:ferredoxin oxidoreductase
MPNGYTGKILHVDLTNGRLEIGGAARAFYRKYMAAAPWGVYILRELCRPA